MNDFTKEELLIILDDVSSGINRSSAPTNFYKSIRNKIQSMIDNYCEHEWRCWDDEHNTRECIKCDEKRTGEIL